MKGGGMSRAFAAGAGLAAMAAMALSGAGGGAYVGSALRQDEFPAPVRAPRRTAWKSGNNRKYVRGQYKGSARAKRATARGGNPARF